MEKFTSLRCRGALREVNMAGRPVKAPRFFGVSCSGRAYFLAGGTKITPRMLPKPVAIGVSTPLSRLS